jgi:hypothetical protein
MARRFACLLAAAALAAVAAGSPTLAKVEKKKLPPSPSCDAGCRFIFNACVKKAKGNYNPKENPYYTDKQLKAMSQCGGELYACLTKINCPTKEPDCTKLKTC